MSKREIDQHLQDQFLELTLAQQVLAVEALTELEKQKQVSEGVVQALVALIKSGKA